MFPLQPLFSCAYLSGALANHHKLYFLQTYTASSFHNNMVSIFPNPLSVTNPQEHHITCLLYS